MHVIAVAGVAVYLMERAGRRKLMLWGVVGMMFSAVALTITLKLKTADFRQRTRSQSIASPTQLAAKIFAVSREMLAREIDGTAFRLMGVGVSALRPGQSAESWVKSADAALYRAKRGGRNRVVQAEAA